MMKFDIFSSFPGLAGTPEGRKGKVGKLSKGHITNIKRALYQRLGAAPPDPPALSRTISTL